MNDDEQIRGIMLPNREEAVQLILQSFKDILDEKFQDIVYDISKENKAIKDEINIIKMQNVDLTDALNKLIQINNELRINQRPRGIFTRIKEFFLGSREEDKTIQ